MAARGRGRGRVGFGRGQAFPSNDQMNLLVADKVPAVQTSPYPPLEFYPAELSSEQEFHDLLQIKDQLLMDFQTSNFHLKQEDENLKLFTSGGEKVATEKYPLNFDWNFFPLELRPLAIQRQNKKKAEGQSKSTTIDLSWLDKLEKNENEPEEAVAAEENPAEMNEEEVVQDEEFEEEDIELDSDYLNSHFDNGEVDPDDNLEDDDEPTY